MRENEQLATITYTLALSLSLAFLLSCSLLSGLLDFYSLGAQVGSVAISVVPVFDRLI